MFDKLKGLIPTTEYITLVDRKKKRAARKDNSIQYEFECELFLPCEAGFALMDNSEEIMGLYKTQIGKPLISGVLDLVKKKNKEIMVLVRKILEGVFMPQYDFMTFKWVATNIDITDTIKIIASLLVPISEYVQEFYALQGEALEMEMPAKNPKESIQT